MRKAGDAIGQFLTKVDDAYSKRIANMYIPEGSQKGQYGGKESAARATATAFLGGLPLSMNRNMKEGEERVPEALLALNAGVRYGAPLLGAGLAVKGVQDLLNAESNQTSGTLMPD